MPFPLPSDPEHRMAVISWWLDDVDYRLSLGREKEAAENYQTALDLYLKLPGGVHDQALEDRMIATQGKINQTNSGNP